MENEMKRINALEEKVDDYGVYVKTGTSMNMGILLDDYDNIEDEVTWLILYAKEMAKKVKSLENQLNMADRMHSKG